MVRVLTQQGRRSVTAVFPVIRFANVLENLIVLVAKPRGCTEGGRELFAKEFLYRQNKFLICRDGPGIVLGVTEIGFRSGRAVRSEIEDPAKSHYWTLQAGVMGLHALAAGVHLFRWRFATRLASNCWSMRPVRLALSLRFRACSQSHIRRRNFLFTQYRTDWVGRLFGWRLRVPLPFLQQFAALIAGVAAPDGGGCGQPPVVVTVRNVC
jgi:hypothetical protein